MKLCAIFDALPSHDPVMTGAWHYWNMPSGHVMFLCEPRRFGRAEDHLAELGGLVFPFAHETIRREHVEHPALKGCGLAAGDTSYQAMRKMHKAFDWPALDPRE